MSEFWEGMEAAAEQMLEVAGEKVYVAGREIRGVVQPAEMSPVAVPGGISPGVSHTIQVSLNDGNGIADGAVLESRMLKGAVKGKQHFGGGWLIFAGPENRATEDYF